MAHLSISALGCFAVALDGEATRGFESDKVRALLAYLAVESDRAHRREKLSFLLWPEVTEAHAHANFNQALYNLRSLLGDRQAAVPFLIVTRQTVQLNPQAGFHSDVWDFNRLMEECERHPHRYLETCAECISRLERAAALYRGDFLEGFSLPDSIPFEEWAVTVRERLHQQFQVALGALVVYHEGEGRTAQALKYARHQVELDPLFEAGQRNVMRLLALDGQREVASEQYLSFRNILMEALAVEPERETQALYERLRHETQPTLTSQDHLPGHLTPFIGRKAELAELRALLRDPDCRLVTILGAGGSGKTRLALQVASQLSYHFSDGEYLVPLSALGSVEGLIPAVAEALSLKFCQGVDSQAQLEDYLRDKRLLLIMDSFEVVLDGARWLSELLRAAPNVKVLVTSRGRLNITGEYAFSLGGLQYPEPEETGAPGFDPAQYAAMQLFITGAQRTLANIAWENQSLRDLARICRLMQGMPLGLLLASAWVDNYRLDEIAAEIERSLDFLESRWVDVPERQRSLRATLEYSWRMLSPQEQELFRGLSVFQGGFTRQAAVQVAAASVVHLKGLVDKSMLQVQAAGRYSMHDLLRQYAAEKLAESAPVQSQTLERHSQYYIAAIQRWGELLKTARQPETLVEMDAEYANLRSAWERAVISGQLDRLEQGLDGLCRYCDLRGRYAEGESACRQAVYQTAEKDVPRLQALALTWQGRFLSSLGQDEPVRQALGKAAALLEQACRQGEDARREQALLHYELGEAVYYTDRDQARNCYQRSLEGYRQLEDEWGRGKALLALGELVHHGGNFTEAYRLLDEAVLLLRKTGEPNSLARALRWLSTNYLRLGQLASAEELMRESAAIRQASADRLSWAIAMDDLGTMISWFGKYAEGSALLEQSLTIYAERGYQPKIIWAHSLLALLYQLQARFDEARQHAHAGLALAQQVNSVREMGLTCYVLGCAALGEGALPRAQELFQQSLDLYRQINQKDELVWALVGKAIAARGLGQVAHAEGCLREALQIIVTGRGFSAASGALPAAALLLCDRGEVEKAVELYALATRFPNISQGQWFELTCGQHIAAAAAGLPEQVAEAARARARQHELFATAAELLEEFNQPLELTSPPS